ncbi:amidohydrolase [soil metagenome]
MQHFGIDDPRSSPASSQLSLGALRARRPRGLREAHAHLPGLGEWLTTPRLDDCASLGECLARVSAAAHDARSAGLWLARLTSARVQGWPEARWPSADELEHAGAGTPVVIMGFDHHSAAASHSALTLTGLAPGQTVPERGIVEADERGRATGLLLEDAAYAVWRAGPTPPEHVRLAQVAAALAHLADLGFEEVHDLHSPLWLGPALATLERTGGLPMRVGLYAPFMEIHAALTRRAEYESERVRLLGTKLFADGTLNSRTAHLLHRYSEPMPGLPRGQCMIAPLLLDQHIRDCDEMDVQLAIHAIGDGAVRTVLDSVERTRPARNRVRLEHAEIIDRADVPRFAALGVTCSVQPCHLLSDIEALTRFVPHRLDRVLPLRELLESGLVPGLCALPGEARTGLIFGSDVPIVRAEPEDSVLAAVTRRRPGMPPEAAIALDQALPEADAWACFGG